MKIKELRKILLPFFVCFVFSFALFSGTVKIIGKTQFVSACVSLILPSGNATQSVKNISISARNAITSAQKAERDENDSEQTVKINTLAYTPKDIQAMIDKAEQSFDEKEMGGTIVPRTYGEDSATQKEGNVLVKNTTGRDLDISETLKLQPSLKKAEKGEISVLIFHTHTTESYQTLDRKTYLKNFSARSENENLNMVRVGKEIAEQLENAGIGVIHDTQIYDRSYSGAYERSGEAVDKYLEKYPTIQVVLDVHRDAIQTSETSKIKPVTNIKGKKAAQIMIITGCEGGSITDFPDWEKNLRFALRLQKTAEDMYPTLMRPLFFCNRKYNMYKSECSVLLEMGSDANTLDEAAYSGRLIGDVLAKIINNA
ncbi:MAG: stage II sporulation protein P [Clostridia bacterium]|nr:stage II sporulation protein P [Clostridia bacterium]